MRGLAALACAASALAMTALSAASVTGPRAGRSWHTERVVALGGNAPMHTVTGDQGAIKKRIDYLLACAPLQIVGEPAKSAIAVVDGVSEDGMLRSTELRGHLMLLCG